MVSIKVLCVNHFLHVRLFGTLWTVACQAPLSMGFSRQEYWSGLPCPPPGDLPNPWIKPTSLKSPALADGFFTTGATWEAQRRSCCSVAQSCLTLCNPMDCSTPRFPVFHHLPERAQTRVHRVGDAMQPSHPLLSPSPLAFNLPQHQSLFQRVGSSHQVAKVSALQHQHQSFQ